MIWWIDDKARLAAEIRAVEALAAEADWLTLERWTHHDFDLAAELTIRVEDAAYPARLVYPTYFPDVPAWVAPRDDSVRWSDHQFGAGGSLCLELRPDNWTRSATGADTLKSAHSLLRQENPLGSGEKGTVPSAHTVTAVQRFDWDDRRHVLIDTDVLARLRAGAAEDLEALRWYGPGQTIPMFVSDAEGRRTGTKPPSTTLPFPFFGVPVICVGVAVPPGALTRAGLLELEGLSEAERENLAGDAPKLAIFGCPAEPMPLMLLDGERVARRTWWPFEAQTGVRNGARAERAAARIAVVGAGSVGAKIAASLVRSGARRLHLVDGDVLLPPNLERHALDWSAVGARKTVGLKDHLLSLAPDAVITTEEANLSWQRSARVHAAEVAVIGSCKLIVDATGDPATSLLLGSIAAQAGVPFVSTVVFEGGVGALVAACVPGRDPPYVLARAGFDAWCETQGHSFPKTTETGYGGFDEDGAPIVADDAAVTVAAGHAARAILDIVDGKPAPRARAWQLIGLQSAWVFGKLGMYIALDVGGPPPPQVLDPDPETDAFVKDRVEELLSALAASR